MGSMTLLLTVLAISFVVYSAAAAADSCPLPTKVYSCSPKCVEKYDCSGGRVCCPNSCHTKSCVEPAPYGGSSGDKYNKQGGGGGGIYCNNVKCNSFEVCKKDTTGRMKCQRA